MRMNKNETDRRLDEIDATAHMVLATMARLRFSRIFKEEVERVVREIDNATTREEKQEVPDHTYYFIREIFAEYLKGCVQPEQRNDRFVIAERIMDVIGITMHQTL